MPDQEGTSQMSSQECAHQMPGHKGAHHMPGQEGDHQHTQQICFEELEVGAASSFPLETVVPARLEVTPLLVSPPAASLQVPHMKEEQAVAGREAPGEVGGWARDWEEVESGEEVSWGRLAVVLVLCAGGAGDGGDCQRGGQGRESSPPGEQGTGGGGGGGPVLSGGRWGEGGS